MFVFNGKKFAKNDSEMVDSLFQCGGTCVGFYKKKHNGIALYNLQNELIAFIVNNKYGERFVVSAGISSDGKPFYMNSTSSHTNQWLGLDGLTYSQMLDVCISALNAE